MAIKITLTAKSATVEGRIKNYSNCVEVTLTDIDIDDIVDQVGKKELLEAIGQQECMDYFGLVEES